MHINVNSLIRNREYRQNHKEKATKFCDDWGRSKRCINTLGFWTNLEGHTKCVNTINFSKGGELLVSGSDDKEIRIWNVETRKTIEILRGHISNVFAADFLPYRSNKEIISGANDADMRHYDIEKKVCTVYCHHSKKVLRLSINPQHPDCFLSCSADGTIRMIDVRKPYASSYSHTFDQYETDDSDDHVIPQAFGGGRPSREGGRFTGCSDSLVLDYRLDSSVRRELTPHSANTLFSVDFHPHDGYSFIVGSAFGNVRLYDLRKIHERNPAKSYINIYRNYEIQHPSNYEITGCVFSKDGTEIVATALNNYIYVFDVNKNYEKEYGLDYFATPNERNKRKRKKKRSNREAEKSKKSKTDQREGEGDGIIKNCVNVKQQSENEETHKSEEMEIEDQKNDYHITDDMEDDDDEESWEDDDGKVNIQTYKNKYMGHFSSSTIKGVNFYGPNSEFVISGSDDSRIFIWDKKTTELLTILEGHKSIVNCIVGHPTEPMIASSGIDNVVKLWQNTNEYPTPEQLQNRKRKMDRVVEYNNLTYSQQQEENFHSTIYSCTQQ